MKQGRLRQSLLATSSVLAMIAGVGTSAQAITVGCAINNTPPPINNTTTINCISFNNGGTFTGPVTNATSGTLNASGGTPNQPSPGTATGISVVGGSHLVGNITNNGTITTSFRGINVGGGQYGPPGGNSVIGNITNNGSITANRGIELSASSSVTGNVINNGTISYADTGINLVATSLTAGTLTGSIANNGTIKGSGGGISVQHYTVTGSISNTDMIDASSSFAGIAVSFSTLGSVAGVSISNSGTITVQADDHNGNGISLIDTSTAGSIVNSGTINADNGIGVQGFPGTTTITGDIVNSGTIKAGAQSGIFLIGNVTVTGSITNSGSITTDSANPFFAGIGVLAATVNGDITNTASGTIGAKEIGIYVTSFSAVGSALVKGSIVNQGTITAKTGIAIGGGSSVTGGITNSGNITGTRAAIDLTLFGGAGSATTINQQGGTITGDILLSANADAVKVTGGAIAGDIVGGSSTLNTVNFALGAGHTFTYSNEITGVNSVTIDSGTVFDNNSITATSVKVNGGTLAAGMPNTVGTLTITGSLMFSSAATYLVNVTPSAASKTNVSGPATLSGTVQAVFAPGSYVSRSYDILHASTLGGTMFNPVVTGNVPANFQASLSYTATDVFLNLIAALGSSGGFSGNQNNVANAINNFFNNGGALPPGFVALFSLPPQQLAAALSQLSGEPATGAQQGAFLLTNAFLSLLVDSFEGNHGSGFGPAMPFAPERAAALPPEAAKAYAAVLKALPAASAPRYRSWAAGFDGVNRIGGDPAGVGSHDLTTAYGGVAAGFDYRLTPDTVVGVALAGGGTSWALSHALGGGRSNAFLAGVYGSNQTGPTYLSGALAFSNYWVSTSRTVAVAGTDQLEASFKAQSFGGRLEGGFRLTGWAPFTFTPYAALQAQVFTTPAYSENATAGSPQFALSFNARNATALRVELGGRAEKTFALADLKTLSLFGRAAWAHDRDSDPSLTPTFLALPGASFVVNGAPPPPDLALVSAGAELRLPNSVSMTAKFDGEFGSRSQTYAGTGKLRFSW